MTRSKEPIALDSADPPVSGAAALPAAIGDMVDGTVRDVNALPDTAAEAAAFPSKAALLPLLAAQFINSYDTQSMNVAIQNIVRDLGTTVTGVQSAISLYTLVMAAGMITGSKLAGIWGLKRTFIAGVTTYGCGALITSLSPSLGVMVVGWSLLEGLGSVLMIPPIYILITVTYHDLKTRAAAFGALSAAGAGGAALGPLLGGIITTAATWRLSFALEVLVVLAIIALRGRISDPGVQEPRPKLDVVGAILSALGMVALVLGALLAGTYGFLTAREPLSVGGQVLIPQGGISPTLILLAIGVLILLGFGAWVRYRERQGKEPLVRTSILLHRVAVPGLVTQNVQWFLSSGVAFVMAIFLQLVFGFSAIQTGLTMTPVIVGVLFFSRRSAQLAKRFPPRRIMLAGFLVAEAGVIWLLFTMRADSNPLVFLPGLLLIGSGIGLVGPASVNVVQSAFSDEEQSEISGVSRSASNLGSSLGVAVAGAVLISALISGITELTNANTTLPPETKQQIMTALQGSVSAVSDAQVEAALQGQPEEVVQQVVAINAEARNRAIVLAMLSLGIFVLVGIVASLFLPGRPWRRRPASDANAGPHLSSS